MAKNNAENVGAAKPKIGGCIYRAPLGTTLPTNATSELAEAFVNQGYISDDGITESEERDTDEKKAFGGDVVARPQTSYSKSYNFTFIETNEEVMKTRYGSENVSGDYDTTGLVIKHTSKELERAVWVIDLLINDNLLIRKVIHNGQISETGEINYQDGELVAYEVTMNTFPDENSVYVYEYQAHKSASSTPVTPTPGNEDSQNETDQEV